ncbi:MAG: phosphoribosylanthranilate isomerase [Bacteroidales bacterium]
MLKVKVCGLNNPANTEKIAATLPDFMGFIFHPLSRRYVGDSPSHSLFAKVPDGILKTGVFVNAPPGDVIDKMNFYNLDILQLHGEETPEYCSSLKKEGLTIIKAFAVSSSFSFMIAQQYMEVCDYFLFDTNTPGKGGSGIRFDWNILDRYNLPKQFFLSGGIGPDDASLIKNIGSDKLFAVDINSRFESRPGIKGCTRVRDFINEIKR